MKVTGKQEFILLPVKEHVGNLRITDFDGKEMIILPDREIKKWTGWSMDALRKLYLEKLEDSNKRIKQITGGHRIIAVMFNRISDGHYEKIKLQWEEEASIKNYGPISLYSEIPIYIPRYGFNNSPYAIYLSIKTDSKHEILEPPKIEDWKKGEPPKFITILDGINHKVYRFEEAEDPQLVRVNVKMGVPRTVTKWAKFGLLTAIAVPTSMIMSVLVEGAIPPFAFGLLAGVIALLFGERVLIFRDIPLMKRWSGAYLYLAGWSVAVLVFLMIAHTVNQSVLN